MVTYRLSTRVVRAGVGGWPLYSVEQVSGPSFGGYVPPIKPTWNEITGDSAGFTIEQEDEFYGLSIALFQRTGFAGRAMLSSDALYAGADGIPSVEVARTTVTARRVNCPR